MIKFFYSIRALSRNKKITIVALVDLIMAICCWIIFGPPLSVLLTADFDIKILDIILLNYLNFIYQAYIDLQ
jgi:uncharacterized membrane protein YbaN (DUF454 family)